MFRVSICLTALILSLSLSFDVFAEGRVGIVILHGKSGKKAKVQAFADAMRTAGALAAVPTMPYPAYSGPVQSAFSKIDATIEELRKQGADLILVGGVSMGANTSLAYGANREGLGGILAIAPGHVPDTARFQKSVGKDYLKAKKLIESGKGTLRAKFKDSNQGKKITITTTADIYYSWFNPDGEAVIPKNAANLKSGTRLLWVVGTKDKMFNLGKKYAFARAPANADNHYLVVNAGHTNTIVVGGRQICDWIAQLALKSLTASKINCALGFRNFLSSVKRGRKKCRDGDMAACRRACARGKQKACARLHGAHR